MGTADPFRDGRRSGWDGKAGDMYFCQMGQTPELVAKAGNISWDNVNKVLDIAGSSTLALFQNRKPDHQRKNGAMSGSTQSLKSQHLVPVVGGGQESIDAQVRKTIIK